MKPKAASELCVPFAGRKLLQGSGGECLPISNEPTAAAIAYGLDQKERGAVMERMVCFPHSAAPWPSHLKLRCKLQAAREIPNNTAMHLALCFGNVCLWVVYARTTN